MNSDYKLDPKDMGLNLPNFEKYNFDDKKIESLSHIIQPKFDPHQELKRLEQDLRGFSSDFNRPDKSMFIRPREEENQMWDTWFVGRMTEISAAEQRYQQMVSSAVDNGQLDSFDATKHTFGLGTVASPFEKLRREAREVYNSGRKF